MAYRETISYEVMNTPTDILMVMEYASGELFQRIVDKGRVRSFALSPGFEI